jgi:hypothetical protein
MRAIAAVLIVGLAGAAPALAQTPPEGSENGRYTFKDVPEGLLRLDSRNGHVSLCSRIASAWACRALPDDREALESEIGRLLDENTTLKKELQARAPPPSTPSEPTTPQPPQLSTPAPQPVPSPPQAGPKHSERQFSAPNDEDVDRMMSFLEKMWRRLLDMAERTQREFDSKGRRKDDRL